MNQYETGKHVPDFLIATKIAAILEVPTAYLYTEDKLIAEIILKLYLLSDLQKLEVLKFIDTSNQHTN
ncbi:hypothetical protein D3C80_2133190 [compost metagenome]